MRVVRTVLSCTVALALAGCSRDPAPAEPVAPAVPAAAVEPAPAPAPAPADPAAGSWPAAEAAAMLMAVTEPGVSGTLTFTATDGGVRLTGTIAGLDAGATHALHLHENGRCEKPKFQSAGAHFNPSGAAHGNREGDGPHHAGDIPNQVAGADGVAQVDQMLDGLTIGVGGSMDIVGKSVIVHAQRDDYRTQPSGDAGGAIACGLVSLMRGPPPPGVGPADEWPDDADSDG
jgi:Cu-Zn family superoxide dismutase